MGVLFSVCPFRTPTTLGDSGNLHQQPTANLNPTIPFPRGATITGRRPLHLASERAVDTTRELPLHHQLVQELPIITSPLPRRPRIRATPLRLRRPSVRGPLTGDLPPGDRPLVGLHRELIQNCGHGFR